MEESRIKDLVKQAIIELLTDPNIPIQEFKPHLPHTAKLLSHFTSAEYLRSAPGFDGIKGCWERGDFYDWIFANHLTPSQANGLFAEFGVAWGTTINHMSALRPDVTFYGFDGFEGIPEPWYNNPAGSYTQNGTLPAVNKNVDLVVGWFDQSLPKFTEVHGEFLRERGVSMIHVDCDIYSSTVTVFEYLGKFLRPGSVVIFDEYWNYQNWEKHEHKAWTEFCRANKVEYKFIAYTVGSVQAAVIIESIGSI